MGTFPWARFVHTISNRWIWVFIFLAPHSAAFFPLINFLSKRNVRGFVRQVLSSQKFALHLHTFLAMWRAFASFTIWAKIQFGWTWFFMLTVFALGAYSHETPLPRSWSLLQPKLHTLSICQKICAAKWLWIEWLDWKVAGDKLEMGNSGNFFNNKISVEESDGEVYWGGEWESMEYFDERSSRACKIKFVLKYGCRITQPLLHSYVDDVDLLSVFVTTYTF